jgi:hypothetical protein
MSTTEETTLEKVTDELDAELDAHFAERAAYYELKDALGAEMNKARLVGLATNGARVSGGYNYDRYRDALEEFVKAHKTANRAWGAYDKVRMSEERRKLVAYHEAGHAVIGRVLDIPIKHATIEPKALNCDGCVTQDPKRLPLKAFSERDVMWTFAGNLAEQKFTGEPGNGAGGDNEFIRCHSQFLPKAKRRTVRADLKARTEKLVGKHWPEIEEVARELLRVGTVSGDRIDAIMSWAPMLW